MDMYDYYYHYSLSVNFCFNNGTAISGTAN